jgi:hypothetical protein
MVVELLAQPRLEARHQWAASLALVVPIVGVGRPEGRRAMWDAFVDAWAIAAGAVSAPPHASGDLQQAASILLGLAETGAMDRPSGGGRRAARRGPAPATRR